MITNFINVNNDTYIYQLRIDINHRILFFVVFESNSKTKDISDIFLILAYVENFAERIPIIMTRGDRVTDRRCIFLTSY